MFEVIDEKQNVKTVKILLPHEEVEEAREEAYADLSKNIKVKGFRQGMVPKKLLNAIIGTEKVNEMIKEIVADKALDILYEDEKFQKENLMLPPALVSVDLGKTTNAVFEIHNYPEVTIESMDGEKIEVPGIDEEGIEEDLEDRLQELREQNVVLEPKDEKEAIEIGDQVELEYNVKEERENPKEFEIVIKDPEEGKIFSDLIGKKVGDTIEFEEDNGEDEKKSVYFMTVKRAYKRILPNLDDEFAKTVDNDVQTFEELKTKLRNEIKKERERFVEEGKIAMVLKKLESKTRLNISEHSLNLFINHVIARQKREKEYERALKDFKGDEEKYRNTLKEELVKYLKIKGAVEKLSSENDIKISEDEIFENAKNSLGYLGVSDERLKVMLSKNKNFYDRMRDEVMHRKVAEELLKTVKVEVLDTGEEPLESGVSAEEEEQND